MKKLGFALALAACCVGGLLGAAPAAAAVNCSYSAGSHDVTITMSANADSVSIGRSGDAIQWNFINCGAATVTNTHHIVVNASAGQQQVAINLENGPFAPGNDGEASTPEIEFELNLQAGFDYLSVAGQVVDDKFRVGSSGINLNGDADADITPTGLESINLSGGLGNDQISALGGLGTGGTYPLSVTFYGGVGSDALTGGLGHDQFDGGENDDTLVGGDGNENLYGGPGADTLQGGSGRDIIYANQGNDTVDGGPGQDTFYASADPDGNDVFVGGTGTDLVDYYIRGTAALNVNLDGIANDGKVGAEFDNIQPSVENVNGTPGPNVITGTDDSNQFFGRNGSDTLNGGAGEDSLNGEGDADTLNGGDDDDTLTGSTGSDYLNGQGEDDALYGNLGNDVMTGGSGQDSFWAESGLDGSDSMMGGPGEDQALYFFRSANLTITLNGTANDGEAGENDNVGADVEIVSAGGGHDNITGSSAPNTLYGNGGDDTLNGGAGSDYLYGYDGGDTISGGDGPDNMYGFNGSDHFKALDGSIDTVTGGSDAGVDIVDDKDAFDNIFEVP